MNEKTLLNIFIVAYLLFLLVFLSISSFKNKSITLDEEKYIKIGRYVLKNLHWSADDLNGWVGLHPPLTYYIHGPTFFLFSPKNNQQALFYARLMMQPILILFALSIFLIAKKMYGFKSGILALFLFVFNTEILAHGRLISPDLSLAFFIFLSLISFYFFLKKENIFNALKTGIFLGLAFMTKYNALLLIPLLVIILIYDLIFIKRKQSLNLIINFLLILVLSFFIINLGYGFKGSFKLPRNFKSVFFTKIAQNKIGKYVLMILPKDYLRGADYQYYVSKTGWITFLMGETGWGGKWYYFIVAFFIKTPIPFLVLTFLYLVLKKKDFFEKYLLFSIFFFFFYNSFLNKINTGLRYLLMIFPLLILLVSSLINYKPKRRKRFYKILISGLIMWYIVELLSIYPHYLAYFNQFIGGPKNGYKYLADSNLDFGQDWETAQRYFANHKEIKVNPEAPTLGKVAVSVNFLNLNHDKNFWLRKIDKKPIGYINYSWLIFDIEPKDLEW